MRKEIVTYTAELITEQQISAIRQVDKHSFRFGKRKSREGYKQCISSPNTYGEVHVIIRESDDTVVGYIHFKPNPHNSVLLCNMAIGPQYRGQGAGTFALEALRQTTANRRQNSRIILHVRASNEDAIKCYSKSGYVETGRVPHGYRNGVTDEDRTKVTMELELFADAGTSERDRFH